MNERLLIAALQEQERAAVAKREAAALEHQALHDALTGLPNRALYHDRLRKALQAARRERSGLALLVLDLDGFKEINDTFGHAAGDLALQQVAVRLRGVLRDSDTAARLGGDEFAVLLPAIADLPAALAAVRRIEQALAPPIVLHGELRQVGASIGIAHFPEHGEDPDDLTRQADTAMYAAKQSGGGHAVAGNGRPGHPPALDPPPSGTGGASSPPHATSSPVAPAPPFQELQTINERLLIAGLREQELADQLRRQLAFNVAISASLSEGVVALDRAGRITFFNPAAQQLLGWTEVELLGQDAHAILHARCPHGPDESPGQCPLQAVIQAALAAHDRDDVFARKDGTTVPVAYSAAPITTAGEVTGVVTTFRDMSARQQTEQALAAHAEAAAALAAERRAILAQLSDGVIIAGPQGNITFVNDAARRLLGVAELDVPLQEYASTYRLFMLDGEPYPSAELALARAVRQGETVVNLRRRIRRPDGTEIVADGSAAPIFAEDGRPLGAVLALHDVTAEVELERQKEEFLTAVAHDLRSPLTAIRGFAQLLRQRMRRATPPVDEKPAAYLDQIDHSAAQMGTLLADLLDLGRLQLGQRIEPQRRPTDLATLARAAVAEHQQGATRHRLCLEGAQAALVGRWDAGRLERALANLLGNAIKYSPDGRDITVHLSQEEGPNGAWAVLSVQDQGLGIPAADLPHLFERFRRGSNVVGRIAGTGIGLASAKQIAEEHGGSLSVESTEGRGSTFTLRLPLGGSTDVAATAC